MKKIILILIFLSFLFLPWVSADLITPGFHSIPVINNITNFNDFPDYYFLSVCTNPMPRASIIQDGGIIGDCYKFSQLSVYTVKKSDFNVQDLNSLNNMSNADFDAFFNQSKFQEILKEIQHYETVSDASPTEVIYNEYIVNITQVKTNPDNRQTGRNNFFYLYLIISLIALILIIIILARRKNADSS